MEWMIRTADKGEVDRLALIGAATFLETFAGILPGDAIVAHCRTEHGADAYRQLLADPRAAAWFAEAEEGGAPVGYALVTKPDLEAADPAGGDLELKRIYSLSHMHGSGIGPKLMECAVEHAEAQRARRLLLGVFKYNVRAIAFYKREGFVPIAERQFRVGNKVCEDLVLAKPLGA
jgi:diamine N-acetyltransferase